MIVSVSGVSVDFREGYDKAVEKARRQLGIKSSAEGFLIKRAVDARRVPPRFVYTIGFNLPSVKGVKLGAGVNIIEPDGVGSAVQFGTQILSAPPVIAGFGPAGMFAALTLARHGYRPIVLERGTDVDTRVESVNRLFREGIFDADSNIQFGEGGAGTFSDGKLTTRINDRRCTEVLKHFVAMGADSEILWQAKPHIGTDHLRKLVIKTRESIVELGGEVRFLTKLEDFKERPDGTLLIRTNRGELVAGALVLAIGHSARDTVEQLSSSLSMEVKPFSVGFRIEHPQAEVDRAMYGEFAGDSRLPSAEYQLWDRQGDRGVYTFCMCPGGLVVPAMSEAESVATNGMSYHSRAGKNANSAIVVSIDSRDFGSDVLGGIRFQQSIERACFTGEYRAPVSTVGSFMGKNTPLGTRTLPSYVPSTYETSLENIYPKELTARLIEGIGAIGRRAKFFSADDAVLTAPETRTSSPVRILRTAETFTNPACDKVYPSGEGAGYAGGIMSASVDGIKVAEKLMARFAVPK